MSIEFIATTSRTLFKEVLFHSLLFSLGPWDWKAEEGLDVICNHAAHCHKLPNDFHSETEVTHVAQTLYTSLWTHANTSTREQYEHNPQGFFGRLKDGDEEGCLKLQKACTDNPMIL